MSVFARYVGSSSPSVTTRELIKALRSVDQGYTLKGDSLRLNGVEIALVDVTKRGHPFFKGGVSSMLDSAQEHELRDQITPRLQDAEWVVTVHPLLDEQTGLKPLWNWLRTHRSGMFATERGSFRIDA